MDKESARQVAIVTDSTACIPPSLVEEYGISVVPLTVAFGGRTYRDGVEITPQRFYQMLREGNIVPTTAAPSPGEFREAFLHREAQDILCLCPSPKLTGVYGSALVAKESLPSLSIRVLPLPTAAGGQGLAVLAAAGAAAAGQSLAQIMSTLEQITPGIRLYALVDTLDYLRRSGRVNIIPALAASLLDVKPILTLQDGSARLQAVARTKPRALERLLDTMSLEVPPNASLQAMVFHADALEDAQWLQKQVAARFRCAHLMVSEFTPVMGVHTGPGLVGLAFYMEK